MKVYIDRTNMKLLGVEKERTFYTGDSYSSDLTVYFNQDVSAASVTLSFLLSNGRTPRKNLIADEIGTTTYTEAKFGQTTWYNYKWNLSTKEGILVSPGLLQMTLALTTGQVIEQVQFTNTVTRTTLFGADENIIVFGEDPEDVILDFATNITTINSSIASNATKISLLQKYYIYIGDYTTETKSDMVDDAFEEVYQNDHPFVSAVFDDNLVLFMKNDASNEASLIYFECGSNRVYLLAENGTKTELFQRVDEINQATLNAATAALNTAVTTLNNTINTLSGTVTSNKNHCDNQYAAALTYTDQKIAALVGEAPSQLDTIVELANQITSMLQTDTTLTEFMQEVQTNFVTNDSTPVATVTLNNNTDYKLSGSNIVLIKLTIPSTITTGYACALHWVNGSDVPTINITNNSSYTMKFLVNNTPVNSIALENPNGIVNALIMLDGDYLIVRIEEI